jgi:hypothetical protein
MGFSVVCSRLSGIIEHQCFFENRQKDLFEFNVRGMRYKGFKAGLVIECYEETMSETIVASLDAF